jgi:hypothetical protein
VLHIYTLKVEVFLSSSCHHVDHPLSIVLAACYNVNGLRPLEHWNLGSNPYLGKSGMSAIFWFPEKVKQAGH